MAAKSDFMAAEEIKALLHGKDAIEQARILRWVTESLGLVSAQSTSPTTPAPPATPASPLPTTGAQTLGAGSRSKDIKSFVNERKPKNDVQFAAVTAYFYRFECPEAERTEAIVPKVLDNAGRLVRGYSFKNARQTLDNGVKLGYFDRAGKGAFKLNAVGENLVAMTLPGTAVHAHGSKHRRPKKKAQASKKPKRK